eukprot:802200-Pleurochrysis_carterae.AAC.3
MREDVRNFTQCSTHGFVVFPRCFGPRLCVKTQCQDANREEMFSAVCSDVGCCDRGAAAYQRGAEADLGRDGVVVTGADALPKSTRRRKLRQDRAAPLPRLCLSV